MCRTFGWPLNFLHTNHEGRSLRTDLPLHAFTLRGLLFFGTYVCQFSDSTGLVLPLTSDSTWAYGHVLKVRGVLSSAITCLHLTSENSRFSPRPAFCLLPLACFHLAARSLQFGFCKTSLLITSFLYEYFSSVGRPQSVSRVMSAL